jgi:tRNA1Val (adenine37-N6)-methyltransferase
MEKLPVITSDTLFNKELFCNQHKPGYRFSIDSVLLAHYVCIENGDNILDLGCGCGIIALVLMYRWKERISKITGLEYQKGLFELASYNSAANGYDKSFKVIHGDLRHIDKYLSPESYSQVVCNPPFYKAESGRSSKNSEALIARHQIKANIQDIAMAAKYCVRNKGKVTIIYPASYLSELLYSFMQNRLEPKKMRMVYSKTFDEKAQLVLLQAVKNGGRGLSISSPLYIYNGNARDYSAEVERFYSSNS